MTDPELDAPTRIWIDKVHGRHPGDWGFSTEALGLSEKDHRKLGRLAYVPETALTDLRRQLAEANQRADAAEVAAYERAVQGFTGDGNLNHRVCCVGTHCGCMGATAEDYVLYRLSDLATDKRPALDALLRAEREKALREAADRLDDAMTIDGARRAILALIDKEPTNDR